MSNVTNGRRRKFSWWRRCIFSLIPVLLLLPLIEGLLALAGIQPVTTHRDPYVGFAGQAPLFEEITSGPESGTMTTAYPKLVWFNPQSFPRKKPSGTKRIFCLGGSTTFGRPYSDPTSYVGWLRELLPVADRSPQWEVINAGGVSYASYRVAALMEELAGYEPDLFVVFSAHNEFLERRTYAGMFAQSQFFLGLQAAAARTRTFALLDRSLLGQTDDSRQPADVLPTEVDERLNHTIGPSDYVRDPIWQRQVVEHYRVNIARMVEIAHEAHARIVFITPASNEKDCSPFKSELDARLTPLQRSELTELMNQAHTAAAASDHIRACELYRQVLNGDAGLAEAHYRLGQSLFAIHDFDAAHAEFRSAIENDICPLRAIGALTEVLRDVTHSTTVPLVEFDALLGEHCQQRLGHQCLGKEFFLDHVHPDIDTHRELAMWIIDELQRVGIVRGESLREPSYADAVQRVIDRVVGAIDQPRHGVALRNLAKVLHWSGKFAEAAPRASDALELLPGDAESRFVLADCLKNMRDTEGALQQYELLFEDAPHYARGLLPYSELLVELELYERAKPHLLLALLREPENAYALFLLGIAHLRLGEAEFAVESLEKADQLFPDDPQTQALLGEARAELEREGTPD